MSHGTTSFSNGMVMLSQKGCVLSSDSVSHGTTSFSNGMVMLSQKDHVLSSDSVCQIKPRLECSYNCQCPVVSEEDSLECSWSGFIEMSRMFIATVSVLCCVRRGLS